MSYLLGLVASAALCGFMVLDPLFSAGERRRRLPVALLALSAALWAAGEIATQRAASPADLLLGRRVLYLGAAFIAVAWLWIGLHAAQPRWIDRVDWLVLAAALPMAGFYSCLYWDSRGLFVDWYASPPVHGPLFPYFAAWGWIVSGVGYAYFARGAYRFRAEPRRLVTLGLGFLLPMLGNLLYNAFGVTERDWTPILLGASALLLRLSIFESPLALYLPLARSDVVEQLEDGILIADLEGRVVDANPAAGALLGERRLVGRPLEELVARAQERPGRCVEARRFPLEGACSRVGTGALLFDRTQAEIRSRRLQQASRLESLGRLTAGIAHEVNNPLSFVSANLGAIEKLIADLREDPDHPLPGPLEARLSEAAEIFDETHEGVRRIADLVGRLKRFAGGEPDAAGDGEVQLCDVARRAASLASLSLPPDALHLHCEAVPPVRAPEAGVLQILIDLILNATQASGDDPRVEVRVEASDGGAAVRVADRGRGIPPEALSRIFDPFYTTRPPGAGMGLGLSLGHDLARQLGGRIEAANREGGGAVFSLWLPRADATGAGPPTRTT